MFDGEFELIDVVHQSDAVYDVTDECSNKTQNANEQRNEEGYNVPTAGATCNTILANHSLAMLVVAGNAVQSNDPIASFLLQDVGHAAVFISTNCVNRRYTVTASYQQKYVQWMDRAVAHLIAMVDGESPPGFPETNDLDELYFDVRLCGNVAGKRCSKMARVFATPIDKHTKDIVLPQHLDLCAELFVDTFVHDNGVF